MKKVKSIGIIIPFFCYAFVSFVILFNIFFITDLKSFQPIFEKQFCPPNSQLDLEITKHVRPLVDTNGEAMSWSIDAVCMVGNEPLKLVDEYIWKAWIGIPFFSIFIIFAALFLAQHFLPPKPKRQQVLKAFSEAEEWPSPPETLSEKLKELEWSLEEELITSEEYEDLRAEILEKYTDS